MMTEKQGRMLKSPARYVQGKDVLFTLDQYLEGMGERLFVIITASGKKRIGPALQQCFEGKAYQLHYYEFAGECTEKKAEQIAEAARQAQCTAIVGIGGGKVIDTAKSAAYMAALPVVVIPTVASSDSPCSSLAILYHDDGTFDRYIFLSQCPDLVLVDTAVIAAAPVRFLVAGMGDAMATWFEARACRASGSPNQVHAKPTYAATGLAEMCWTRLKRDGLAAKLAVEAGVCTEAVECIVETNTYLSSVGFESGGLAAAHAIQKGFTLIPELHEQLHGFNVAFCVLAQLVLEDSLDELREVMQFSQSVGLPICFKDLGYDPIDRKTLRLAADKACVPGSTIHHMPFAVTGDMVFEALLAADAYGRAFHESMRKQAE